MSQPRTRFTAFALVLLWSVAACQSQPKSTSQPVGSGGAAGSGGAGTGGARNTGGSDGTGGSRAGGVTDTGGSNTNSGGATRTGGKRNTGGSNSGGAARTGGAAGTGGSNTGGTSSPDAGSGGDAPSSGDPAPTAVTGLKIEANPKNVLSAFVSWTTDQPGDSVVQFGEAKLEWEIADAALVTTHKVLIIGMHAKTKYQVKALSTGGGKTVSATGEFTAGSLPVQVPVGKVAINETGKVAPGWTLMNVQKGDGNTRPTSDYPAMAVMYDATGQPVWYYIDGTADDFGGAISVDLTDQGVLIGPVGGSGGKAEPPREVDFAGNTLWECADPQCGSTAGALSHHAGKLSNGDYVILRWIAGQGGTQSPLIEQLTKDNKKVWSWAYTDFVPIPAGLTGDWCHGNAVTIDLDKDEVFVNCRWMGLVKTSYKNPKLQWHMAATYQKAGLGDITFAPAASQFTDVHDPEIHDDGTILFFDNGGYDNPFGGPATTTAHHSRAVEYKLDEGSKTATLVWEFPGTFDVDTWYKDKWYQPFWGDADRLANGNVLVAAGERGSGTESRVFEVTKAEGKVVWEFHLGPDIGVYRAERITPPLLKPLP